MKRCIYCELSLCIDMYKYIQYSINSDEKKKKFLTSKMIIITYFLLSGLEAHATNVTVLDTVNYVQ